jgi:lipid II:glycine glycyltransferase (peptidoglycan interpeptide bridge formation enzyme)
LRADEYKQWESFVDDSPQGTICSKHVWLNSVCNKFNIVGCFRDDLLLGGICFEEATVAGLKIIRNPLLTPFIGIHFANNSGMNPNKRASLEKDILNQTLIFLENNYKRVVINNHYSIQDIRAFNWRDYQTIVRYTYIVDLKNIDVALEKIESRTKYEIRKCEKNNINVISSKETDTFYELLNTTYKRKGLKCPVSKNRIKNIFKTLKSISKCKMYFAFDSEENLLSAIFIIWDKDTAFYLMGANNPDFRKYGAANLLLKTAMEDLAKRGIKFFDLCGANNAGISLFKRGFGGELKVYYRTEKVVSFPLKIVQSGLNIFKILKEIVPFTK